MANVNGTVYFREHGGSKIYAVEQAKWRVGPYGIRWDEGTRQRQKIIGQYPGAVAAELKKELELKKAHQKATSIVRRDESMKLDTAIEVFIREREDLNPDSARRCRSPRMNRRSRDPGLKRALSQGRRAFRLEA